MSAPSVPLTVLDERTKEELAPPCQGVWKGVPCADIAEWIVLGRCPKCGERTALLCDGHLQLLLAGTSVCLPCYRSGFGRVFKSLSAVPERL